MTKPFRRIRSLCAEVVAQRTGLSPAHALSLVLLLLGVPIPIIILLSILFR